MRGPRRFCSLAFQFLMRPLRRGDSASSRTVCIRIAIKGFIDAGSPGADRRKKLQAPSSKLQRRCKNQAPKPLTRVECHCHIELRTFLETGARGLMVQLSRAGCALSAAELEVGIWSFPGAWSLGFGASKPDSKSEESVS